MNPKKLISMIGAIALLLGIGMNFRNALNDYGMAKSSLNGFMLVQAATSNSSSDSAKWVKHSLEVTCSSTTTTTTVTSTTSTTTTSDNKTNTKTGGLGVSGGTPVVTGNLTGSISSQKGNSTATTTTTNATTTTTTTNSQSTKGTKIDCQAGGSEACLPYDPCAGK